jgi:hypothetical protein
MVRLAIAVCAVLFLALPAPAADSRDPLARARTAYNQRQFDAAIAAGEEARRSPDRADSADLVVARAYLERFREGAVADDLAHARERLRRIDPNRFSPSEHFEFLVGLGEALYLDDETGAAAVIFDSVLTPDAQQLPAEGRERVLDWWASALDRDARPRPEIDRRAIYQRIRDRMAAELAEHPASSTAAYWASAAARGQGDLQAAWDAAQAGWVRASLSAARGEALRTDLDRLMQRAIVPERSRILSQPPEALIAEWEQFKEKWREPNH